MRSNGCKIWTQNVEENAAKEYFKLSSEFQVVLLVFFACILWSFYQSNQQEQQVDIRFDMLLNLFF